MDQRAQKFTKGHYDGHSNKHQTQQEAQRARQQGPGLPLKKYHNDVKRQLINRFAQGAESLLDLACGRGGDIWKWNDAGIAYVKGLDLSPGEIQEAKTRFADTSRKITGLQAEFEATEDLGEREVKLDREFDAITCMFAIHYFFASAKALDCFLHNVAINLKEGCYFFGTCPDGRLVTKVIKDFGRWPDYKGPMLELHACWQGDQANFGSGYTCAIGDTVTQGHGSSTGSYEYLVFRSTLIGAAKRHGLYPVENYGSPTLDRLFAEADRNEACKHFAPKFPETGNTAVDVSLSLASKLNMAFCFQKRTAGPNVGPSKPTQGVKRSRETDEGQEPPSKRVDTLDGKKNAKLDSPAPKSEKPQSSSAHLPEGMSQSKVRSRSGTPITRITAPVSRVEKPESEAPT